MVDCWIGGYLKMALARPRDVGALRHMLLHIFVLCVRNRDLCSGEQLLQHNCWSETVANVHCIVQCCMQLGKKIETANKEEQKNVISL